MDVRSQFTHCRQSVSAQIYGVSLRISRIVRESPFGIVRRRPEPKGKFAGTCESSAYWEADSTAHGFVRAADGTITTFDPPGSQYTYPNSINPAGTITGYYTDYAQHGFVRAADGTITTFDPPGSTGTIPWSINPAGTITGWYEDASYNPHGFVRAADGTITTFDPPGSTFTRSLGINPAGRITGWYSDGHFTHGFVLLP